MKLTEDKIEWRKRTLNEARWMVRTMKERWWRRIALDESELCCMKLEGEWRLMKLHGVGWKEKQRLCNTMPYREMWFIICLYTPRTYTEEINWQLNCFVIVYVNFFF